MCVCELWLRNLRLWELISGSPWGPAPSEGLGALVGPIAEGPRNGAFPHGPLPCLGQLLPGGGFAGQRKGGCRESFVQVTLAPWWMELLMLLLLFGHLFSYATRSLHRSGEGGDGMGWVEHGKKK